MNRPTSQPTVTAPKQNAQTPHKRTVFDALNDWREAFHARAAKAARHIRKPYRDDDHA